MEIQFKDYYFNDVFLSFDNHPFSLSPKHVWVICRFYKQWLVTNHATRGLEFPGGNVEEGETPEQAAIREVKEETGGNIIDLQYIGQYMVMGKEKKIIKNIYFANINSIEEQPTYYETKGPVLLDHLPDNIAYNDSYSFIMKDGVLQNSLKRIRELMNE
ncbi:RNA deprotection pyrophosphohydrolase [Bacillus sp. SCS-151]|uniref:RNA deprotection pyrophosphohydrolase n=1 Tax=Nanhaiella sioensis TaxID=3115293 RepID=UPI00397C696B